MSSSLTVSWVPSAQDTRARWGRGLAGTVLGGAFSAVLFFGIAHIDQQAPATPAPDIADLHAVTLLEPPPPPPEVPRPVEEIATPLTGIAASVSDSPVRLALTPPDLEALLPPPVAPPARIEAGVLYTDLKPKVDTGGFTERIYQMAEVDQLPQAIRRVTPELTSYLRRQAPSYRTTVLFTVEASGEVKNVRVIGPSGEPEVDTLVVAAIEQWTFTPAVKRGRKVRCLLQQLTVIKVRSSSPLDQ